MKKSTLSVFLAPLLLCGSLAAADAAVNHSPRVQPPHPETAKAVVPDAPEVEPSAKVVQYGDKDVVKVKAKVRYTTLIVLPKNEQILDFTCGDKEYWVVNGTQNFAYIKPAKAGAETNLNLITASGTIYSFVLVEVSARARAEPDLKVSVEPQ